MGQGWGIGGKGGVGAGPGAEQWLSTPGEN